MKKLQNILIFTALLGAMGCKQSPQATIEGTISEASGKVLYLDHIGVEKTVVADSAKLDKEGTLKELRNRRHYEKRRTAPRTYQPG